MFVEWVNFLIYSFTFFHLTTYLFTFHEELESSKSTQRAPKGILKHAYWLIRGQNLVGEWRITPTREFSVGSRLWGAQRLNEWFGQPKNQDREEISVGWAGCGNSPSWSWTLQWGRIWVGRRIENPRLEEGQEWRGVRNEWREEDTNRKSKRSSGGGHKKKKCCPLCRLEWIVGPWPLETA